MRGATLSALSCIHLALISIHAPTRGATIQQNRLIILIQFQSTLPRGERQFIAPATGATYLFQSTLPRGERPSGSAISDVGMQFQSTLPRGERPCVRINGTVYPYFNPRSHEGSDLCESGFPLSFFISIHAPTRGATLLLPCYVPPYSISIHAPTRGATRAGLYYMAMYEFQSTLPRGGRLTSLTPL